MPLRGASLVKPYRRARILAFEVAFTEASDIISHQLQRYVEKENRYLLLVHWEKLEDLTVGFRSCRKYHE